MCGGHRAPVPASPGRAADEGLTAVTGVAFRPFASVARRLASGGMPRRTVRMRLALAYGALFLLCGTALLAISYVFVARFPFCGHRPHHLPLQHHSSSESLGSNTVRFASPPHDTTSPGSAKSPPPGARPALAFRCGRGVERAALRRLALPAGVVRRGVGRHGRGRRSCWDGSWPAGCCARCGRSPPRRGTSPRRTSTSGLPWPARVTRSRTWPAPSTGCSPGWRAPSTPSEPSWPTPRMSFAPRWR